MGAACKNRPVDESAIVVLAQDVEDLLRDRAQEPTSEEVGMAVLEFLGKLDQVAYVRFASVYKGFDQANDFAREVGNLVKTTAPKHRR